MVFQLTSNITHSKHGSSVYVIFESTPIEIETNERQFLKCQKLCVYYLQKIEYFYFFT